MLQPTGRTSICSIVFLDIVGFSKRLDSVQFAVKAALTRNIAEAVAPIAQEERIILDTGDGAAICFMGDPEDALFVATAIMEAARQEHGPAGHELKIGINLGPIKIVTDVGGHTNVVGDGINVAQRIMSFAGDGEILVARSYYEVMSRLKEGNERLFRYLGTKTDKHVREHQVYVLAEGPGVGIPHGDSEPAPARDPEPVAGSVVPELVREAERRRLAERIGPLAEVIVRRAAASARDIGAFYDAIATAIPDEADRADFLAGAAVAPAARPEAAPEPDHAPPAGLPPPGEAEIAAVERHLAKLIGPLASVLVRQAARAAADRGELIRILADKIPNEDHRQRFLAEARWEG